MSDRRAATRPKQKQLAQLGVALVFQSREERKKRNNIIAKTGEAGWKESGSTGIEKGKQAPAVVYLCGSTNLARWKRRYTLAASLINLPAQPEVSNRSPISGWNHRHRSVAVVLVAWLQLQVHTSLPSLPRSIWSAGWSS